MNKIELRSNPITPSYYYSRIYYPFGMVMPGREYTGGEYKFGFNGKEIDRNEMGGGKCSYDYGFRIYSPSLGRFFSVDPLLRAVPWASSYIYAENDVVRCIDIDGLEKYVVIYEYYSDNTTIKSISVYTVRKVVDGKKTEMDMMVYYETDVDKNKISGDDDILVIKRKSTGTEISHREKLNKQEKAVYRLYMKRAAKVDKFIEDKREKFHFISDGVKSSSFEIDGGFYGVEAKCIYGLVSSEYKFNLGFAALGTTAKLPGAAVDGKVRPDNGYVMESFVPKELKELPKKIKEDGGITGIEVNLYSTLGTKATTAEEAEFQNGLTKVGENIKNKLITSGVDPSSIKVNVHVLKSDTTVKHEVSIKLNR